MEQTVVFPDNGGRNRHGYPQGYHFVPREEELIRLLEDKIAGRPLPYPLFNIFHDARILDFHPDDLHEAYKAYKEKGHIYFFSRREFPTPRRGDNRARPVRVTKDGGNWKASGGGKPVKHGGVAIGYELTMVFYNKERKSADDTGKTDWGMHEFTKLIGPAKLKKVADLALYRLYKKKTKEAGEDADTLSDGIPKLEEVTSPDPTAGWMSTASTSQAQAQAQARVWQPHPHGPFGAAASAPGPSNWMTAANPPLGLTAGSPPGSLMALLMAPLPPATTVNCSLTSPKQEEPQQQAVNNMDDLADWDGALTLPLPIASEPATVAHDLPKAQQQQHPNQPAYSNQQPMKMIPPALLPEPAAGDYLEEFKAWYEKQQEEAAASPCSWFPMPGEDDDLPMLMDDENNMCTMNELLGGMRDDADVSTEEPADTNKNGQVKSSKSDDQ